MAFPTDGLGTSLSKGHLFTRVELEKHIRNSGKKPDLKNVENYSLPTGLRKPKAFLADEYFHNIQTCDQMYLYYRAKCFHRFKVHGEQHNLKFAVSVVSGDVEYAYCGPSRAAGRSGFCNHILALTMKLCKYSLNDAKSLEI